ncbi:CaiB/BaiF CoA-transferase family protein [Reyranella sp. CPCC 100927]|uniref:CaiB/BaiF CoA transferase family protein n=1 Tax=Reyranella sp. CPCC 100927 TaxID=2599616 RepID=UPI0011B40C9A|nr:CoA transferase [Reyranella sp. CPCC 100927]TWS94112.1 CoA transferase [Reyranella sp. CPCC 100927]
MQALEGIKVLDLGRALAGPMCGLMLADLGADVIKIEPPGLGDDSREWPPMMNGESSYFLSVNRNKRSIVLDLASPEGKEVFLRMAETADVVVENYRADVMERLGLGYDVLRHLNPRLIYCALTGFGRTGPRRTMPATDVYAQAFAGIMGLTGEPGGVPLRVGVSLCDLTTGLFGAYGVLAALQARHATGQGQLVDTSLMEGQMAYLSYLITGFQATGKVPQAQGRGHPSIVPYGAFRCRDGWVALATFNDRLWRRAAQGLGLAELAQDPRFDTNPKRLERRDELLAILDARFLTKTVDEWVAIMEALDVPLAPVNTLDRLLADPQVAAREMVQTFMHPTAGEVSVFGFPVKFSETPCTLRHPPPILGQHTREVLREYGFDDAYPVGGPRDIG